MAAGVRPTERVYRDTAPDATDRLGLMADDLGAQRQDDDRPVAESRDGNFLI